MLRTSKKKLFLWVGLTLLLLPVALAIWLGTAFPGFSQGLLADLRLASWNENYQQYRFLYYYAEMYARLQRLDPEGWVGLPPPSAKESDLQKGLVSFHRGEFAQAARQVRSHIRRQGESESALFWLANALMRQAEADNCLASLAAGNGMHEGDLTRMCSLPLEFPHHKEQASRQAAVLLEKLLDDYSPQDPLYRWLLNFCYMTLGGYPEEVPKRYRIQNAFTESFYGDGKRQANSRHAGLDFRDRARHLGVDTLDAGKGVAVEDFDGDGWMDIVTGGTFGPLRYYRNLQGRAFRDATAEAGLDGILQPYIISAADYDNDGWMDLFASRPFQHFQLMRNRGDGSFEDVTFSSGLLQAEPGPDQAVYSCVSAWGDVDNDGDLDLMLAQFGQKLPFSRGLLARRPMPSRLFLNQSGRFVDGTARWGLEDILEDRIFLGAAFGDYDRDGWADLFLSSFTRGQSVLLRNLQGRRLEPTSLIPAGQPGFMAAFVDVDHDGRLDLFQGSQSPARIAVENTVFGRDPHLNAAKIFLQGAGGFSLRADLFRNPMPAGTMGANFGDLDNDGCYDFYLGTGNPESWYVLPNLMYRGELEGTGCTGRMSNISMLFGFGTIQKGHGIVFFDFDNDGDQDVYSSLGGMWPGDAWPNQLFVNQSSRWPSWVKIRLRGRRSNRFGLGAVIRVEAQDPSGEAIIRSHLMDNGTGFGSTPYLAHIGLMDADSIRRVEVAWPASGCRGLYEAQLGQLNWLDEEDCLNSRSADAAAK